MHKKNLKTYKDNHESYYTRRKVFIIEKILDKYDLENIYNFPISRNNYSYEAKKIFLEISYIKQKRSILDVKIFLPNLVDAIRRVFMESFYISGYKSVIYDEKVLALIAYDIYILLEK